MISLKKYLDLEPAKITASGNPEEKDLLTALRNAYGSALLEMGSCSMAACPVLGAGMQESLSAQSEALQATMTVEQIAATEAKVGAELQEWGRKTAKHAQKTTSQVKELLLVLAQTAESVGERDLRCASQITDVTAQLKGIASLDDLGEIRASIEKSAANLKTSVDRMTSETKEAIEKLKAEVCVYQARVKEAEAATSRDLLTGVRSRLYAETHLENRLTAGPQLCVAILDINGFKKVNDELGHLVGDELLKQFATELKAACRSTDVIARWGGDEFILLMDMDMDKANAQMERTRKWVFGDYTVETRMGKQKLKVDASIGLAERQRGDTMKTILERADVAMYRDKAASRAAGNKPTR